MMPTLPTRLAMCSYEFPSVVGCLTFWCAFVAMFAGFALLSAAKVRIGQAGRFIGQEAVQIHGGMGLTTDLPIERMWRDQRSFIITEGPTEILKMALARHVLRQYGG